MLSIYALIFFTNFLLNEILTNSWNNFYTYSIKHLMSSEKQKKTKK